MSQYRIKTTVNYPLERVFKVFIDLNKREIPKFNDKNPVGCSNKRIIKNVAQQKIEMVTTVTGYEKNKLYEVTNLINGDVYISKYNFKQIDNSSTEISLIEIQNVNDLTSKLTILIEKITANKRLKNKINNLKDIIENELKRRDEGNKKIEVVE